MFTHTLIHALSEIPSGQGPRPITYFLPKSIETDQAAQSVLLYPLAAGHVSQPGKMKLSFNPLPGCAKKVVAMMKEAGVTMTGAGATYPYHKDPEDRNIRIAPSYATLSEVREAIRIFAEVVKLAREADTDLKVIVGGAPVTKEFADEIGADGYSDNGAAAAELVCELISA